MDAEKWNIYIDTLQGHPSVCQSKHSVESMKHITNYIPPQEFPNMLNIGAGEGLETKVLHDLGYNVIGIIRGKSNLDYASEKFTDVKYMNIDMHDLPFPSNSFDAIYTNHAFEHSFAPFIFLLEMYCILRDNGRLWIAIPEFKEIDDPTIGESNKLYHLHPNMLCHNLFKQMFEATGFKILYNKPIKDNVYFDNPYLLEKQPISFLHSDVKTAVLKRSELLKYKMPSYIIDTNKNNNKEEKNIFGDGINWENHIQEILNTETEIYYNKNFKPEKIKKLKEHIKNGKVLDCGCHIGRWINIFRENGYDYTGVDQSRHAIKVAKIYQPDGNFIHSLLWKMNFYEEFDILFTNAVLQHNTLEEQDKILPKIYQALKPDGILYITESTENEETDTQRTYDGWINFIENHGFTFIESFHKNSIGLEDNYIFIKMKV